MEMLEIAKKQMEIENSSNVIKSQAEDGMSVFISTCEMSNQSQSDEERVANNENVCIESQESESGLKIIVKVKKVKKGVEERIR